MLTSGATVRHPTLPIRTTRPAFLPTGDGHRASGGDRNHSRGALDVDPAQHNKLVNFIWGLADDVLRDLYVRGKYRDVILPMTVLRRLDAVLEPTKQAVLDMKTALDKAKIVHQDQALRQAA